jgi:adenosylhomocysteinase
MDEKCAGELYSRVCEGWQASRIEGTLIVVTHVLPDNALLVHFLAERFTRIILVAKPHSINSATLAELKRYATLAPCGKDDLKTAAGIETISRLVAPVGPIIVADMGGYFAERLGELNDACGGRVLGVVEDTANGHRRYAQARPSLPVISLARSRVKAPENELVGQAIATASLRAVNADGVPASRQRWLVLGYGELGSSIATTLSQAGCKISVFDTDPLRCAIARARKFDTPIREEALSNAAYIVSATGAKALTMEDLPRLRDHCAIASVTSPDDEFDFHALDETWPISETPRSIETRRNLDGRTIRLINGGKAANFMSLQLLGAPIFLMHAAILRSIELILASNAEVGLHDLSEIDQGELVNLWNLAFTPGDHTREGG